MPARILDVSEGPALHARLVELMPTFAPRIVERVLHEVPYYRQLPPDEIDVDIHEIARYNLELFSRVLRDGTWPSVEEVQLIAHSAIRRAEEGLPMRDVLAANGAGLRACWDAIRDVAESHEMAEVVALGSSVLDYMLLLSTAVTEGYVETVAAGCGRDQEKREVLLESIGVGEESSGAWERAGLVQWQERTVVALRVPPPDHANDVTNAVDCRRRIRAIREALAELSDAPVLDTLSATGGTVLMSGQHTPAMVTTKLQRVLADTWSAGCARVDNPEATSEAMQAAADTAEVAERLELVGEAQDIESLRFEVQVTRPGPARTALMTVLQPLVAHRELLHTLQTYLDSGGNRRVTSERLHVHVNTVDYRLTRIETLTSINPTEREGWVTLRAAATAYRFVRGALHIP